MKRAGFLNPPETPVRPFVTDWADFGWPVSEFGFPLLGSLEFAVMKPLPCPKKSKELARNVSEPGGVFQVIHTTHLSSFAHHATNASGVCVGPPGWCVAMVPVPC